MSKSRFASLRTLMSGSSLSTPPEDEEDNNTNDAGAGGASAGNITVEALDAAVAKETNAARKAESDRWSKVMTSDEGAANPKGAARLLTMAGGASSADEVIAALADMPASKDARAASAKETARQQQLANDAKALGENEDADPDTGPALSRPGARTGEGESRDRQARLDARKQRQEKRGIGRKQN